MAGRGPAPKDPRRRARRNADSTPTTVLRHERASAPSLPPKGPAGLSWPAATKRWWSTWKASPQAEHFGSTDWSFLLDTAALHARFWHGDVAVAPELRLRVAKFGATMEDRARLRMQFAAADEADEKRARRSKPTEPASRQKYGHLRVLGGESS